jgi:hypothetical protein
MDLGSAHKLAGDETSGADRKGIMARNGSESIRVLINHWRWLEANGYKQQAASCKQQASSLTRKQYRIIKETCKQKKL